MALALGLGFLLGLGVLFGWLSSHYTGDEDRTRTTRIAVLPFAAVDDTSDRAFAAGMSEEITTRLARLPRLQLIARSSALRYPTSGQTAPEFGRALGVDYVLDGTVRSAARSAGPKQLRITPELIRVADGTRIWGDPYEGLMADVFRLQADIAERVAESLRGTLAVGEQHAVRTAPTNDLEAFRLYTLGRAEWHRRTPAALKQAAEYFQQAIARDSAFARAWSGVADAYALYDYYGVRGLRRDTAAYGWAREAAMRAIAQDSTLAEPHASLNQILRYGYWNWAGSEKAIRRAIALDPDYATAHKWLAEHLITLGRLPEAIAEAKKAVQLDPLAPSIQVTLGIALWYSGQAEDAIAVFRSALERDAGFSQLHVNLFDLYRVSGRISDALSFLTSRGDTSTYLRALARATSDSSAREFVVRELHRDTTATHVDLARVYAYLGERDRALVELERAAAERDPRLEMIKVEPHWAQLRQDPRFQAIIARMGLPP
jgi:TolB-like protein/tetratricopeptide (TPR) repeat protein